MKAWQNGTTLWVFDEPAEIPSVAAGTTIIYVQQELLEEFKEENEEYASLMQPYNYKLLTVKKTVWADHVNDDLGWDITITGDYASHFTCPATGKKDTLITITPNSAEYYEDFVTLSSTQAILNWSDRDTEWTFTMPDEDITITTATASHNITKTGDFASNITVPASSYVGEQVNVTSEYTLGTDYTLTAVASGESVTINTDDGIYFIMPAADVTLTAEAISYNITKTGDFASNITVPASSYAGEQVNVTSEYTLGTDYTLTAYAGTEPVTINTDDGIYFTMPAADVTLTAEAIAPVEPI